MKTTFFPKIIAIPEGRPFLTTVFTKTRQQEVIVQIAEDDEGYLQATLWPPSPDRHQVLPPIPIIPIPGAEKVSLILPKPDTPHAGLRNQELIIAGEQIIEHHTFGGLSKIRLSTDSIHLSELPTQKVILWYPLPLEAKWEQITDASVIKWKDYEAKILRFAQELHFQAEDGIYIEVTKSQNTIMTTQEVVDLIDDMDHALTFLSSKPNQAKIAIGFTEKETNLLNQPTWAKWLQKPRPPQRKQPSWFADLHTATFNHAVQQILGELSPEYKHAITRYSDAFSAYESNNWKEAINQAVAILGHLHHKANGHRNITKYIKDRSIEPHHFFKEWQNDPNYHGCVADIATTIKDIYTVRSKQTAHWDDTAPVPDNFQWLTKQAIYYVESCLIELLIPLMPNLDRVTNCPHQVGYFATN